MTNKKIPDLNAASTPLAGTELLEIVQGGFSRKASAADIAATASNVRTVATGGTGAATLTGYVKGSGTAAFTASATIPYNDLSGRAYLAAHDNTDQAGNVAAATAVKCASTDFGTGITIENDGGGNPTRITYATAGIYMLAPSIQLANSANSDYTATFWLRKDGVDVPDSATMVHIPKLSDGGASFFQIVLYEQVTAGQYLELMWLPSNASITLEYTAAGAIAPAVPSVILVSERIA